MSIEDNIAIAKTSDFQLENTAEKKDDTVEAGVNRKMLLRIPLDLGSIRDTQRHLDRAIDELRRSRGNGAATLISQGKIDNISRSLREIQNKFREKYEAANDNDKQEILRLMRGSEYRLNDLADEFDGTAEIKRQEKQKIDEARRNLEKIDVKTVTREGYTETSPENNSSETRSRGALGRLKSFLGF